MGEADLIGVASMVLSAASVVGVVAVLITLRRGSARSTEAVDASSPMPRKLGDVSVGGEPDNPFASLSFEMSLDGDAFGAACREFATRQIQKILAGHVADGVTVTVNSVSFVAGSAQLIVTASKAGAEGLASATLHFARHSSSGRRLPQLQNTSGRIAENMKEAFGARTLTRLASGTAIIVGLAHMIAGYDIAKRLHQVDRKLDQLLAGRRFDQVGRLERIYSMARELMGRGDDPTSKLELWRLRGELRELRAVWRHEMRHYLLQIDSPDSAMWLSRMFTSRRSVDQKLDTQLAETQIYVALLEYALRLEIPLAVVSGATDDLHQSLSDEVHQLRRLADLLNDKAERISADYADGSARRLAGDLRQITDAYSDAFSPRERRIPAGASPSLASES